MSDKPVTRSQTKINPNLKSVAYEISHNNKIKPIIRSPKFAGKLVPIKEEVKEQPEENPFKRSNILNRSLTDTENIQKKIRSKTREFNPSRASTERKPS